MLRAASRGIHRRIVRRNSSTQLTPKRLPTPPIYPLPNLCPWQIRWSSSSVRSTVSPSEASQRSPDRLYSTAAAALEIPQDDASIIFPPLRQGAASFSIPVDVLEPLEPKDLVLLDSPVYRGVDKHISRNRTTGVPSGNNEVLATFDACISVGMLARAQLMLEQISKKIPDDEENSPALVNAHNTFLKALLDRQTDLQGLKVFFMWYENKMKAEYNINGDATTFALLFKASLQIPRKDVTRRYLTEYADAWKQGRAIAEVLESNILSSDEVFEIAKICRLRISELGETHQAIMAEKKDALHKPDILSVPQAKSTPVKGAGLAAVKSSLRSLIDPQHIPLREYDLDMDDADFQIERQKLLEEHAFDSAQERWKKDFESLSEKGLLAMNQSVNVLLWEWHRALVPLIKEELHRVMLAEGVDKKSAGAADRCLYGPFLRVLAPEKIAAITMIEILRIHASVGIGDGMKTSRAVLHIGKQLELEYLAQEVQKKKNAGIFGSMTKSELAEILQNRLAFRQLIAKARNNLENSLGPNLGTIPEWPVTVRAKLGAVLISMLIHVAKIPVESVSPETQKMVTQRSSAFHHAYEYIKGRKLGVIKLHPELIKRLGTEELCVGALGKTLPMVVRPLPWTGWQEGGYYYTRSRVVRIKDSREQEQYVKAAAWQGHLDQVFSGLDVLGQTAWKINKQVFDVVLEVWNSEEKFAEIPAACPAVDYPLEPESTADPKTRYDWVQEMKRLQTAQRNNHSTRCDINFKVEIARAFLFERFYFPHNVDFRGRAYPIPPNLNHIGNDLSRGLLMFADGKELGESGLRWLKIHLANLVGYDKASFQDRMLFAQENMAHIADSAKKPLTGERWWLKAEDPWQCLAACIALKEALDLDDPRRYRCHIPVAQDGTCNGLQHYAALGGDIAGARQVNLEPSDKPQDVYTGVAELVRASVEQDRANGVPEAIVLENLITRKVVKQTVMTNVYGVTFIGARNQIEGQLQDIETLDRKDIPKLSMYLTKQVFASIREMFSGANLIQNWLTTCAKKISRSVGPGQLELLKDPNTGTNDGSVHFMTSVVWTTPLRLPVVQPYRQHIATAVSTNLQNIYINDPNVIDRVDSRKQMTAFPPNFIHSLDASHMLLSALNCAASGLTFASVHDSFWTHPSDVDEMNRILRDAFVALHSKDLMKNLEAEFKQRYNGFRTLAKIRGNTPCAKEIKKARKDRASEKYNRSNLTAVEDLMWEIERWGLISSPDKLKKELGEAMMTPNAIMELHGGLQANEIQELAGKLGEGINSDVTEMEPSGPTEEVLGPAEESHDELDEEDTVLDGTDAVSLEGEEKLEKLDAASEEPDIMEDTTRAAGSGKKGVKAAKDNGTSKKKPATKYIPTINVWVELKFPELPPKGTFDVTRLRESEYFFS